VRLHGFHAEHRVNDYLIPLRLINYRSPYFPLMKKSHTAHVFNALVTVVIVFQIALAFGMPWGELTWGGKFPGVLPMYMRGACILSAILLMAFALVVSVRAGLLLSSWQQASKTFIWVVIVYGALGVIANAVSPSYWERAIWLPVALVLLACGLIVAKT